MTKRMVYGVLMAVMVATAYALLWIPGCGIVDVWLYIWYGCDAAGGGGSGAS